MVQLDKITRKRSMDTRATENPGVNLIVQDFNINQGSDEEELVGDEESSIFNNSFNSNENRKSMIEKRKQKN